MAIFDDADSPYDAASVAAIAQRISKIGIWQYDVDAGRAIWSEQVYKLAGLPPAATPPPFDDLAAGCSADEREAFRDRFREAIDRGGRVEFEHRVVHPDGEEKYLRICGELVQLDGTGSGRLIGTVQDVTSERRAKETILAQSEELRWVREELRQENQRFRSLFDQAPVFLALGSAPDFRFEYVNQEYLKLVGNRPLVGKTVAEALPEVVAQGLTALLAAVYETGEAYRAVDAPTRLYNQPDGSAELRYLSYIYQPIRDAEGRISGILCIGYDVTEQHIAAEIAEKLRAELFHSSRMAAMGTMAATLAHELNQPLTALANYASGLLRGLDDVGEPMLLQGLEAIQSNAQRAGEIIRRMRAIGSGAPAKRERLDLRSLISEAVNLPELGCEGAEAELSLKHRQPVHGDPIQVQQVVINLVRNACEAMLDRDTQRIHVTSKDQADEVVICVSDSGPGVAADLLPVMFEAKSSAKEGGMGIGLAICRTIVEAHGGRIGVHNEEDGGATFWFSLPKFDA